MRYRVHTVLAAREAISDHARWLLEESGSTEVAERWVQAIFSAVDSLEAEPRSHPLADEDLALRFEVRKLVMSGYTLLFTVFDDRNEVWVIGTRGRGMLPRPRSLRNPRG